MKYEKGYLYTIQDKSGRYYHIGKWVHWREDRYYLNYQSASRCIPNVKRYVNTIIVRKYPEPTMQVSNEQITL